MGKALQTWQNPTKTFDMNFLHRSHSSHLRRCRPHHHHIRTLYDAVASIKCPRDRGLDHAVERERHLRPMLNLKNLIISEPSKSVPLSVITQSRETLGIPFRPIEFVRKYPSIFQEFNPGSLNIQPHIKLTPEVVSLSSEENLLYQTVNYKEELAGRLLKLLMISRINKIPIFLLERLQWELGLPQDYEKVLIPEFPDYFRVIDGKYSGENGRALELVCWIDEFAVPEMEKKRDKDGKIQFSLQYSKEFEMDKKYKNWVDEWQKLPYVSPYGNELHLASKSDESDKWAVSVLHELLNLFVGKKAEKESLLYLGEYLGLRSRFKRAFLQHPGIFYESNKLGIHTVVLREAYKRGMLIERHPLMSMRSKYVQLMNVVKDEEKKGGTEQRSGVDVKKSEGEESKVAEGEKEDDAGMYDSSSDDDKEDEEEDKEDVEGENATRTGRFRRNDRDFEDKNSRRRVSGRRNGRYTEENEYRSSTRISRRRNAQMPESSDDESDDYKEAIENLNTIKRGRFRRNGADYEDKSAGRRVSSRPRGRHTRDNEYESSSRFSKRTNVRDRDTNTSGRNGADYEDKGAGRSVASRPRGRHTRENEYESSSRFSKRRNVRDRDMNTSGRPNPTTFSRRRNVRDSDLNASRRPQQKSDFSGNRERLVTR